MSAPEVGRVDFTVVPFQDTPPLYPLYQEVDQADLTITPHGVWPREHFNGGIDESGQKWSRGELVLFPRGDTKRALIGVEFRYHSYDKSAPHGLAPATFFVDSQALEFPKAAEELSVLTHPAVAAQAARGEGKVEGVPVDLAQMKRWDRIFEAWVDYSSVFSSLIQQR